MKITAGKSVEADVAKAVVDSGLPLSYISREAGGADLTLHFSRELTPDELVTLESIKSTGVEKIKRKKQESYDTLKIVNMSEAELDSYIDSNVGNVADLKVFIKHLAKIVYYLMKEDLKDG